MAGAVLGGGQPAVVTTLPSSLLYWWGLHDVAGADRLDSLGRLPLSEQGATVPQQVTGTLIGPAANFSGGAGKYLAATWPGTVASTFTLSCWVIPASRNTGSFVLDITDGSTTYAALSFSSTGIVSWNVSAVSVTSLAVGSIPNQAWSHLVGSYDGVNISLYTNGVLRGRQAALPGLVANLSGATTVAVGSVVAGNGVGALRGNVQLCGVWSRALTDGGVTDLAQAAGGEVAALYNNALARDFPFGVAT